jgi:hypothetical protein
MPAPNLNLTTNCKIACRRTPWETRPGIWHGNFRAFSKPAAAAKEMARDACSELIGFKIFRAVPTNFSLCRGDSVYFADEGTPDQGSNCVGAIRNQDSKRSHANPNEVIKSTIPT